MHPYLKERETAKSSLETSLLDVFRRFLMRKLRGRHDKVKIPAAVALPAHFIDARGAIIHAGVSVACVRAVVSMACI
jgi:hypothetical protein